MRKMGKEMATNRSAVNQRVARFDSGVGVCAVVVGVVLDGVDDEGAVLEVAFDGVLLRFVVAIFLIITILIL